MTGAEILAAAGAAMTLVGLVFGFWKYTHSQIAAVRSEASLKVDAAVNLCALARQEIAEHKVHAAETFATKAGMQEQTMQLLRAIEGIAGRIDGLHERLDRFYESRPSGRRSPSSS